MCRALTIPVRDVTVLRGAGRRGQRGQRRHGARGREGGRRGQRVPSSIHSKELGGLISALPGNRTTSTICTLLRSVSTVALSSPRFSYPPSSFRFLLAGNGFLPGFLIFYLWKFLEGFLKSILVKLFMFLEDGSRFFFSFLDSFLENKIVRICLNVSYLSILNFFFFLEYFLLKLKSLLEK